MLMGEGYAWDVDELGHLELKKRGSLRQWDWSGRGTRDHCRQAEEREWRSKCRDEVFLCFVFTLSGKHLSHLCDARVTISLHGVCWDSAALPEKERRQQQANSPNSLIHIVSSSLLRTGVPWSMLQAACKLFGHLREEQESKTSWVLTSNQQRIHVEIAARYRDVQPYA